MQKSITINRLGLDKFLLTIKKENTHPTEDPLEIINLTKEQTEAIARESLKALGDITGYEIPNNKKEVKNNG